MISLLPTNILNLPELLFRTLILILKKSIFFLIKRLPTLAPLNNAKKTSLFNNLNEPTKKTEKPESELKEMTFLKRLNYGKTLISSEEIKNNHFFIRVPISENKILECKVIRNKRCCLAPEYDLLTKDDKYLMSSKKKSLNIFSTYISTSEKGNYEVEGLTYNGKTVGNFTGS